MVAETQTVVVCVIVGIGALVIMYAAMQDRAAAEAEAEVRSEKDGKIVCPQCHERGHVTTNPVTEKCGVHGGKATAALLTGGVSLLATGLSQHQSRTEATCDNYGSTWRF